MNLDAKTPTLDEVRDGAEPELAVLGAVDPTAYRRALVETLIEVWKLCINHPAGQVIGRDASAIAKFRDSLKTLSVQALEKRVMALQEQNPPVLAAAMGKAGFKFTQDSDGMRIELVDDQAAGRVITKEEFEATE